MKNEMIIKSKASLLFEQALSRKLETNGTIIRKVLSAGSSEKMKYLLLISFILLTAISANSQQFENIDLEGANQQASTAPDDWQLIGYLDTLCMATMDIFATADLVNEIGPFAPTGCNAYPYSGDLFVSGALASMSESIWHEGIQQSVVGFTIGEEYSISFHQSVVKQLNYKDTSGYWGMYVDDFNVGNSEISSSQLEYNDLNLNWELRHITFIATASNHQFKFLPLDDDDDWELGSGNISGGLRMGIDSISIYPCALASPTIVQEGNVLSVDIVADTYSWLDCDSGLELSTESSFIPPSSGSYSITVSYKGCTIKSDCMDYVYLSQTELETSKIVFSPNPVGESINIHVPIDFGPCELSIKSINGISISKIHLRPGNNFLPIDLSPGIYLFETYGSKGITQNRIVVN